MYQVFFTKSTLLYTLSQISLRNRFKRHNVVAYFSYNSLHKETNRMKTRNWTAGLICTMIAAMSLTAQAGLIMKQIVKSEGKDKSAEMQNAETTISVEGKGMRIDYVVSKNPSMKKGDYMLSNDGGQTFYMVQTKDKSYMKFDLSMAGGMMSMMNMKVSDAKSELISDEAGPRILGYPTRHVKTVMSYTMEMNFLGMKQKHQTVNEMEMWTTTKIDASPFEAWARNFAGKMGNKELDELMKTSVKNVKGVPLKQIHLMMNTDKKGRITTNTVITEVTEIKEQKVSAEVFALPPDYKELTMPNMTSGEEEKTTGGSESEEAPKSRKAPSVSDMLKLFSK
jgi:Domain of unknown function (DUF4412)